MYNANNYGYNPYGTYVPQRPVQQPVQPVQQINMLNGKKVDSIETAMVSDSSMDGNVNYYAVSDGSAIVTKQLQIDGTSKTIVYKPVDEEKVDIKYATIDELKKEINKIDLSDIDDIKEEIKDIKKALKELKKKGD